MRPFRLMATTIAFLQIIFFLSVASAAQPSERNDAKLRSKLFYDNSWAVVIGVNEYEKWPKLESAVNDADAVAARLEALGFNVIKMIDADATRAKISKVLGFDLPGKVKKNDRVFIFYAGHGHTEEAFDKSRLGYIVPSDADTVNMTTAISMDELRIYSRRLRAKHVLFVMDSCYSGLGLTRSKGLATTMEDYVGKITKRPARQMITAGQAGEQVAEVDGHGIFTKLLLRGLDGSADMHQDGVITASELGSYLKPKVTQASGSLQTPRFGRLPGDDDGEFVFILEEYFKAKVKELREKEELQHQIEMEHLKKLKAKEEAERIQAEDNLASVKKDSGQGASGGEGRTAAAGTGQGSEGSSGQGAEPGADSKSKSGGSGVALGAGAAALGLGAMAAGGGGGGGGGSTTTAVDVTGLWSGVHDSTEYCTGTTTINSGGSFSSTYTCPDGVPWTEAGVWSYEGTTLTLTYFYGAIFVGEVTASSGSFTLTRQGSTHTETISR